MTLEYERAEAAGYDHDPHLAEWRWRLLDIEIALADYEIGFGASLVHARHKLQLLHLCRSRLRHTSRVGARRPPPG